MSSPSCLTRARRAGIILTAGAAFAAMPAAADAAAVNLGTAGPFVVLGGSSVTNTGASVLNGDLGVSPGTSLPGFNAAVVNGATHNNDAVAASGQSDLTTAYNVAASEPTTSDLTGQDLGGLSLTAGAYNFASSAQLTGQLTLDAQGDPAAQFVFKIGSSLTTASASSVQLINGASPCNVFWQVGSSATLGSTTAFQGSVLALTSITLNNNASVIGRMLARNGAVTLDDNTLDASLCNTIGPIPPAPTPTPTPAPAPTSTAPPTTTPPTTTPPGGTSPDGTSPGGTSPGGTAPGGSNPGSGPGNGPSNPGNPQNGNQNPPGSSTDIPTRKGTAKLTPGGPVARCTEGFRAAVRGRMIQQVIFKIRGKRIATRSGRNFRVNVTPDVGRRGTLKATVKFTDATRTKHLKFNYRACAAQVLRPKQGPSQFTG